MFEEKIHELYWKYDTNCARTMLLCLGEAFQVTVEPQTLQAAIGLHGAGGFRAQCGLVEGGLMFIGFYFSMQGLDEIQIVELCYDYAEQFTDQFGSLRCFNLRPEGFTETDPPHACERLTVQAVDFTYKFISLARRKQEWEMRN